MLTVPAQQQPQPDAADGITPGELPVDAQGAKEPGWIDTESEPAPSPVNPAPLKSSVAHAPGGEAPSEHTGEAEVTVPDDRWVSLSPQAGGRTAEPTAKQPIPGEQGVGDAPTLQDAEAPDPRTPRPPERIEPPASNSGEAVAEAGTAAPNAPEIPSAAADEPGTVSGEGSRPGPPVRETISRSPESFVHLRVRDEAVSTVDIRLRTHGGNLSGRLHTGDDALMKDLSAGLDSLRRHLGELGYGDVDLNLGTDGRQHRDMYRRNDPRGLAFREVTHPTFTSRPHRTQGHERSLVDVLA